jgi:hypothetical protein
LHVDTDKGNIVESSVDVFETVHGLWKRAKYRKGTCAFCMFSVTLCDLHLPVISSVAQRSTLNGNIHYLCYWV